MIHRGFKREYSYVMKNKIYFCYIKKSFRETGGKV